MSERKPRQASRGSGEAAAARRDQRSRDAFPIVGVGASAGGLEAFTQLLAGLPQDTGMAFVLVQHLDPDHESLLTEILSRSTSLPLHQITDDVSVEPDHIYVMQRDTTLTMANGVLKVQPRDRAQGPNLAIDSFFESLARDRRERAVGIVLSGTASDGTKGLEAIKAEGGITFAQDDSAKYDSMPRSAVASGCVDLVLSPTAMGKELARIASHPYLRADADPRVPTSGEPSSPEDVRASVTEHEDDETPLPSGGQGTPGTGGEEARQEAHSESERGLSKRDREGYKKILLMLRTHSGVDFSLYRSSTIQRRVTRRLVLSKRPTLEGYADFLRGNGKELDALYSDVLISVTSFFRNPETFEVLERKVLPQLLKRRGEDTLRCWVLGCSTGQEAYSIAMAFSEAAEKVTPGRTLQIFATDLNDALLEKARHGLYAKSLASDVAPQRLRRFFVEEQGGYRVSKVLREMVVFARQNLVADPPFSRLDLISCRNLLIYLESDLQRKAFTTFHYALKPGGFLLLGASESVGSFDNLFDSVDKKNKIYSKKMGGIRAVASPVGKQEGAKSAGPSPSLARTKAEPLDMGGGGSSELDAQREADRITINQFGPPGVLVGPDLQILQFRGPTSAFLEPPVGKATLDVLKMAREGLMLPLRATINRAKKDNKPARLEDVRLDRSDESRTLSLEVIPLKNLRERCFLILFHERDKAKDQRRSARARPALSPKGAPPGSGERRRTKELESELAELREYHRTIQEQHDAANEGFQAANEEVQSANEELQSINEELETSKEELESTNEELTTVNEEMSNRNVELNRLNDDLVNLLGSTKLAVIVLGPELVIRRFSPHAEKQLDLRDADVGRPINQVRHGLLDAGGSPFDLAGLVTGVVAEVREQEREVIDKGGRWFSLRVRPYLTVDRKVDGATVVLSDIDTLKRSEQTIAAARDYAQSTVDTVREPLLVLDGQLQVESASQSFYRAFRVTPAQIVGQRLYDIGEGRWNVPRLRELLAAVRIRHETIEDFEMDYQLDLPGKRTMLLNARRIKSADQRSSRILIAMQDITDRKRDERALRESEKQLREYSAELSEAAGRRNEFLAMLGHELRNPLSVLSHGLDLLGKVPADPVRSEELRVTMVRQIKRMGAMLDQLLEIARVISGKVTVSKHPVDVTEIVRAGVEAVTPLLEARRHALTVTLPTQQEKAVVMGDAVRLTQVVENLLTNAAKYTNEGGRIAVTLVATEDKVSIAIRDNGIGIDADLLPRVFEVFTQGPRSLDRAQGGLGLGLPLVQRLAEMHGGTVTATSAGLGEGSEFLITLPRVRDELPEAPASTPADHAPPAPGKARPLRILVVDDVEDNAQLLAELLRGQGHDTATVGDGPAAFTVARTFHPEVVLLDLGLPGMDGYEVGRRLREEHGDKVVIVAVTGYHQDEVRLTQAGFNQHLIKPLDMKKMFTLLAEGTSSTAVSS